MPLGSIFKLSAEMLKEILDILSTDSQALNNICLVGNHTLLELARPYTFRHVNIVVNSSNEWSSRQLLSEKIKGFFIDTNRTNAARYLNITLIGHLEYQSLEMRSLTAGLKTVNQLVNVTHAYLSCVNCLNCGQNKSARDFVLQILEDIPSLKSLKIDGLATSEHDHRNLDRAFKANNLTHMTTRFCNPDLTYICRACPNLRILEIQGGDGKQFWKENMEDPTYNGYSGPGIGLVNWVSLSRLVRLRIISVTSFNGLENGHVIAAMALQYNNTRLSNLEDIFIFHPMAVATYRLAFFGFMGPAIKRFAITPARGPDFWDTQEFETLVEYFPRVNNPLTRCGSLQEYWLPCDGISFTEIDRLTEFLSAAKSLRCLVFEAPASDVDDSTYSERAKFFAEAIESLEEVHWQERAIFHIGRTPGIQVTKFPYRAPKWTLTLGIEDT